MTKTASRTKIMSDPRERMLWDLTYIDSPALVEIDSDSNGSRDFRLWPMWDANKNVTGLLSDDGVTVERYAYTPYGQQIILNGDQNYDDTGADPDGTEWTVDTTGSDFSYGGSGFQGLRWDAESGNWYQRERYGSPVLQFTQPDPGGYVDGMSLFVTTRSNPLLYVDPYGLAAKCACIDDPKDCEIKVKFLSGEDYWPSQKAGKWTRAKDSAELPLTKTKSPYGGARNDDAIQSTYVQVPAYIYLESKTGKNVCDCTLQQDVINRIVITIGRKGYDDTSIGVDYTPDIAKNGTIFETGYGGCYIYDAPKRAGGWDKKNNRGVGSKPIQAPDEVPKQIFWQAKVFVIEAPEVSTHWGFHALADFGGQKPTVTVDTWSGVKKEFKKN